MSAVAVFLLTSLGEAMGIVPLPRFLEVSLSIVPGPFLTHMLACCIGIVAGTACFTAALSGRPHRNIGRWAFVLLLIGAVTSVPVAWVGLSSPLAKAAFMGQAATLVTAVAVGWWAARRGHIARHRACVACAALALSGAPLSRLALRVLHDVSSPEAAYTAIAWFAWLAPFVLATGVRCATRRGTRLRFEEAAR